MQTQWTTKGQKLEVLFDQKGAKLIQDGKEKMGMR